MDDHIATIGDGERLVKILLGHQHSQPLLFLQLLDLRDGALDHQWREPDRRFVDQQDPGLAHQRAAQRQHLLLAAAHAAGQLGAAFLEPREASKQNSMLRGSTLRARRREAPMVRFSSTDSRGNSRRPSGTITTPRATISSVWAPANSCVVPSISSLMLPAVGASRPMTQRISVDLPLPLVPRRATVSPLRTSIERSSMTRT